MQPGRGSPGAPELCSSEMAVMRPPRHPRVFGLATDDERGARTADGDVDFLGERARVLAQEVMNFLPIYDYSHVDGTWCAVVGGHVHRGPGAKAWRGLYIAADFCGGVFVLDALGRFRLARETGLIISSLGKDAAGRIYATDRPSGTIHRVLLVGGRP